MTEQKAFEFLEATKDLSKQFNTFDEMCDSQGKLGAVFKKWRWLEPIWHVMRFRDRFLSRPLLYPTITRIDEVFAEAKLLTEKEAGNLNRKEFVYVGGSGSVCGHFGGTRGWRDFGDGTRVRTHYGAPFYHIYAKYIALQKFVDLVFGIESFEMIQREDGILVVARGGQGIGSRWIALLDKDQTIHKILSLHYLELIEENRKADVKAWGEEKGE